MKKILVLGTGMPQADLIRACKERGYEVYACSYRKGDPGEAYVDHFAVINIVDEDAVLSYVQENGIDTVYSVGSDVAMPTVFTVSEKLGKHAFCSSETAVICNTKSLLREKLGQDFKGNIPYQTLTDKTDPVTISYPLMMKPIDSQGQRGVFRISDHDELLSRFDESMSHSRGKKLILESFVEGEEISVNTFSSNGKLVFFLPSERIVWEGFSGGLIHRHILPGKWAERPEVITRIRDLVERTLNRLHILNGPAYFQIMIDKHGIPWLVEVTPRLDGCHMWRLIRYSTGIDLLSLTLDGLEGHLPDTVPDYEVMPFETEFMCQPPATVFAKDHFEVGDYVFLEWYYEDGDVVHRMNGYMEKCGYAIRSLDS